MENKKEKANENSKIEETASIVEEATKEVDAQKINERLCSDFPIELIMKYNTDGIRLEIERVENIPGVLAHCKTKLFYGKKEYEYWEGQVGSWVAKRKDPFWQYNPERNAALYHKVDGFGEEAVFIANTNQLLILKEGIVYNITPPSNGRTTSSGKENKEIALEIASYYNL